MEVTRTKLDGVLRIRPPTCFKDFRGEYVELYNEKVYREAGITVSFIQDDISVSGRNVLRGIHGDHKTWKLVSCLYGEFFMAVVDCRDGSAGFGKWESFTLSEHNRLQVLVPPSFGLAHLVLSDRAIFHYKQSTYYDRASQFTYRWNDPRFAIPWPVQNPILSERDQMGGSRSIS
ncbi:MAG: dTDP-4-dehydrorhamnose 3,5-epimerase [Candidatus Lindowbacteria bacterium RIFCSPLOWO2_12_FULL_62_27]|nr:MAG: dTDP-4-dehydrorhamnose 3,5-epimerase [Candidatus Lindowbacteria bacterium RIFCSPLOWO2_02_FULL_62_12]OGH62749.1 MAG: dTDP-4-dehydrorhamnose 3,5-epimerase [Candidatus Lindowbacteria bacterium RIFCSPLOWO2_12_FULL_62_27]